MRRRRSRWYPTMKSDPLYMFSGLLFLAAMIYGTYRTIRYGY